MARHLDGVVERLQDRSAPVDDAGGRSVARGKSLSVRRSIGVESVMGSDTAAELVWTGHPDGAAGPIACSSAGDRAGSLDGPSTTGRRARGISNRGSSLAAGNESGVS